MSTHTDTRLRDRHTVVTGGAHGIGRGIAVRCARAGADVSIFNTKPEVAAETVDLTRKEDGEARVYEVDVTDAEGAETAVDAVIDSLGDTHSLVNNAGAQQAVPLLETAEDDWDLHFEVSARGAFFVSKTVASRMVDSDIEGSIVNILSVGVERSFSGQGAYSAPKAAVPAFTTVLARELNNHGITVNALKPGTVETSMIEEWLDEHAKQSGKSPDEVLAEMLDVRIPDRIGQPGEVGHAAVLLLSEEGGWITGESAAVDGGYLKH